MSKRGIKRGRMAGVFLFSGTLLINNMSVAQETVAPMFMLNESAIIKTAVKVITNQLNDVSAGELKFREIDYGSYNYFGASPFDGSVAVYFWLYPTTKQIKHRKFMEYKYESIQIILDAEGKMSEIFRGSGTMRESLAGKQIYNNETYFPITTNLNFSSPTIYHGEEIGAGGAR